MQNALAGDPLSAYGGIVGLNRPLDAATAELLVAPDRFIEAIVAPRIRTGGFGDSDHQAEVESERANLAGGFARRAGGAATISSD